MGLHLAWEKNKCDSMTANVTESETGWKKRQSTQTEMYSDGIKKQRHAVQ